MADKALILGYFGAANWGDELILRSFLRAYREILVSAGISLSVTVKQAPDKAYREALSELYPGIRFVPMSPLLPMSPALAGYRYLFCPGGSLLQNATSNRSLSYYLSILNRFTGGKRRALLLNQGIGPITGDASIAATKRTLSKVALFTARDGDTMAWIADAVPEGKRFLSSDGVFACEQEFAPANGVPSKSVFIFVLREGVAEKAMEFTIGSVPRAYAVDLVALQPVDLEYLREVRIRTVFPHDKVEVMGPLEFARRLPGSSVVVSERYHGLIAALAAGVPFVGIGDDPKIISICKEAGMPYFVRDALHEATAEDLLERANAAHDATRLNALTAEFRRRQDDQKKLVAAIVQGDSAASRQLSAISKNEETGD